MADGNLVRQSQNGKDSVVFGPSVYDVPLLPYERELIKTVGITEEEYRFFTAEVKRRGKLRPAEYAHIPDVRNGPVVTPILINLAISLVLTGVAYLLSPKPKMPSASKRDGGGTIDTGDVNGASRFTPSRGFETLATLADYAAPIPIIFGRYDSREKEGGMLTTPKLVWSRMFSEGTNQRAQLLFVVGEQGESNGIKKPDLQGIFLGNNVLDSVFKDFYAFYWKRDSSDEDNRRIRATDKAYGTNNGAATGDPLTTSGEVFVCPTPDGPKQVAFCHAFSPANSTEFGVYAPIANGTGYRLNYEIISIPSDSETFKNRSKTTQLLARVKIAGDNNFVRENPGNANGDKDQFDLHGRQGQKGMGRNYSPRMGIIRLDRKSGDKEQASASELRKTVTNIRNGDVAFFRICRDQIKDNLYLRKGKGESVSDINTAVRSAQFAADDAMRLGEQFQIGGCIWKVTSRSRSRFEPEKDQEQQIELTCIDTDLSLEKKIGVVSLHSVLEPEDGYIGDTFEGANGPQTIGEAFWPITKVAIGVVRNNRPAVATEIGIKSNVFQNLRGLCSFSGLPSVEETNEYDEDNLQVRTGKINSYIVRTSVFRVFVRQVGSSNSSFNLIPLFFAVRGHRPVDQYTFIRFENIDLGEAELEFKFAQLSGSELRGLASTTQILNMSEPGTSDGTNVTSQDVSVTLIGRMRITVPGEFIEKSEITKNKEFLKNPRTITGTSSSKFPKTVVKGDNRPAAIGGRSAVGILDRQANIAFDINGNDPFVRGGKTGAFTYALYGDSDASTRNSVNFKTTEYHNNNHEKWMVVAWKLRKDRLPDDHYAKVQNGQQTTWVVETAEIISSGPGFSKKRNQGNSVIEIKRGQDRTDVLDSSSIFGGQYPATNPFVNAHPNGNMKSSGQRYNITDLEVIDTYHGRAQGYRYVLFGDARDKKIGTTKEITKTLTHTVDGTKKLKLKLKATVKTLDAGYQLNETIGWSTPQMTVVLDGTTTSNIEKDDFFRETVNITASNPYRTVYDKAGVDYVVASLKSISTDDPTVEVGDFEFAEQTQYSDISHYRDFVEKSNANSPEHQIVYVNEIQEYENEQPPVMNDLTLAGLSLKAGRNFSQLDQLRCWLAEGIPVERLHPNKQTAYEDSFATGPSNLLTDLVYYLLTNQMGGAGGLLGMTAGDPFLVDKPDMIDTSKFLYEQKLFFNGPITERTNLRQFIADVAPYFLCNFVVTDGKFSLKPAFPVNSLGQFNQGAVPIAQLFTEGNILEDSYKVEYLGGEERRTFQAIVRYRKENPNKLPEEKAVNVKGTGGGYSDPRVELLPQEQFDLTRFCTSEHHAVMVAKYFLSLRKLVTHTISFSTTLDGLNIAAGSYIKVATRSSPYSSTRNGTISASGAITSLTDFADGQYKVSYFKADSEDVQDGVMTVSNKTVSESTFANSVFAMIDDSVSQNVYVVEQLTFSQEGTVDIVASEHPCFSDGSSKLVDAIVNGSFKIF